MSMTRMMSRTGTNLVIPVIMAQAALGLVVSSDVRASAVVKSATGTELTDGASWGGTAPGSGDIASWASTSLGAGLTLGAPSSWDGICVSSALSDITISGASALTLGSGGIDMSASTVNMTLNMPVELAAHQRWTVNNGRILTLTNTISGASMSITKDGLGTVELFGSHTYSGTNSIRSGNLYVGNLANLANLNSASPMYFTGTGWFRYYGKSGGIVNSLVINGLFLSGGSATIETRNWGTSTTIDLRGTGGTLPITRSAGATVDFRTETSAFIKTANGNDATGIIGAWATHGGAVDWAINDGSGSVAAYTGYNTLGGTTLASGASVNYRVATNTPTGNITLAATGTIDINTLRISDTAARTIDVRNGTTPGILRFGAVGGILTSGGNHIIGLPGPSTNGTVTAGGADSTAGELIVNNASTLTLNSVVADNGSGAVALTKSGAGQLTITATNTYSGGTIISAGTVYVGALEGIGAGTITVHSGGKLSTPRKISRDLTLNGGTLALPTGSGTEYAGPIVLTANSYMDTDFVNRQKAAVNAPVSGTGGLTKTGGGHIMLNGTNTYAGPTIVSAGNLKFKCSLYGNNTALWTPENITVASNAVLWLHVGGPGEFTPGKFATLFNGLATVQNNGMKNGSLMGIDTVNAGATVVTVSDTLTDSSGPGGGSVGLRYNGVTGGTLELTGANTYSGCTTADNYGTLMVSSINSVSNNPGLGTVHLPSSNLGAPTTVANGTIYLGWRDALYTPGNLTYTGFGEITDRVICLGGSSGGGHSYRIDQSGSGLLKFISNFTIDDYRYTKTVVLQGSTAGRGEIAGVVLPPAPAGWTHNLTKAGVGTWMLSNTNVYEGITKIDGGTLLVNGSVSTGGVTVAKGGTLGGTGAVGGVVTLNGGDANGAAGAINVRDGAVSTFTLASNLFCNGTAAYPNSLYLDLGDSAGVSDKIVLSGTNSAPTTNSVLVHFRNQLTGGPPAGTCTLIQGGSAGNNYTGYALAVTNAGRKTYSALGASGNDLVVTVADGNAGPANAFTYWSGNVTNVWSTATWYADEDFSSASAGPGYRSNVRLVPASARLSNALGQDYEINSLTVDPGVGAVTIANNTLTLDATADNGNTAGNGITIGNTEGVTIASKVGVAGSQTWTIGSGATGTVTGVIDNFDNGSTLAKAGAGTLYLKGLNVFKGAFTVAEGVVKVDSINNNLTRGALGMSTNPVVLGKAGGGTGTLEYAGGTATSSMYFRMADGGGGVFQIDSSSATQTLSGVISGGGSLAKTGPGTLLLSGFNTYTGITEVDAGKLVISKPYLSTNAVVYLADTNSLVLDFAGSNQIGTLYVNGVRQLGGPVGGTIGTNYYFGTGSIYLPPDPPPAGTMLIIR